MGGGAGGGEGEGRALRSTSPIVYGVLFLYIKVYKVYVVFPFVSKNKALVILL